MKHKHAEVIKAWADNPQLEIQFAKYDGDFWYTVIGTPEWEVDWKFRVKPEKVYPETKMDFGELVDAAQQCLSEWEFSIDVTQARAIANAALRHAIDSGQLVEPNASVWAESMRITSLSADPAAARRARDMAIAEAVRNWFYGRFPNTCHSFSRPNLDHIIASIKPEGQS